VTRGTSFQARFHVLFQMPHDELGHSLSLSLHGAHHRQDKSTNRPAHMQLD
jgi:hypothetical protein